MSETTMISGISSATYVHQSAPSSPPAPAPAPAAARVDKPNDGDKDDRAAAPPASASAQSSTAFRSALSALKIGG
jgi:hypothetical protein